MSGSKIWRKNGMTIRMTPLHAKVIDRHEGRRRCWKLEEEFTMRLIMQGMEERVTVPKGFETDWATLPLFCQLVLGNRDDWAEAATLHDYLCTIHTPQFVCNAWMRKAMFVLGAPLWKRLAFFYGLMLFGYGSSLSRWWQRKDKE